MSTGQWLSPREGPRWFLDAGAESLDFAYTGPLAGEAGGGELLATAAQLGHWLAERIPGLDAADATERDLVDALELRGALARLYAAAADGAPFAPDDVDTLNLFAALPDVPPALEGGERRAGAARVRVSAALSSLAREAVGALAARGEGRIRRCGAEDCRLVYRDESRTDSRRWCSMQRCGNRAKVRAHRERIHAERVRTGAV